MTTTEQFNALTVQAMQHRPGYVPRRLRCVSSPEPYVAETDLAPYLIVGGVVFAFLVYAWGVTFGWWPHFLGQFWGSD